MKQQYKDINISDERYSVIVKANEIIADYQAQGFDLTLRQLFYIFVSKDIFPPERRYSMNAAGKWVKNVDNGTPNAEPNYKWLGDVIADGRLAGEIDWDAITDRTRNVHINSHWTSPRDILNSCAHSYAIDKWVGQSYRPECWIEKDALAGILSHACEPLDVPYFSCRGYTSLSELKSAADRLLRYQRAGQTPIILHLGDHDPSGIDMSRDIQEKMKLFGVKMEFERLALNMDQVEQYGPPPNPAKVSDARFASYEAKYGNESWELDALEPATLSTLIRDAILRFRDEETWDAMVIEEEASREKLAKTARLWTEVQEFVQGQ